MIPEVQLVQKEEIGTLRFYDQDVLNTKDEQKVRLAGLEKAALLGNGYKGKVKIVFETAEGTKAVETTVWQASEDSILLKGGIRIPIHSVREVLI